MSKVGVVSEEERQALLRLIRKYKAIDTIELKRLSRWRHSSHHLSSTLQSLKDKGLIDNRKTSGSTLSIWSPVDVETTAHS